MAELKDQIKSLLLRALNEKDEDKKEVENEDKRKIIDEVGGILKGKVDEEVWRTVIGKLEKLSYEPSEDDKADNCGKKAKNADEEEKEEKFEEEKEIAENKKAKNEDEEKDEKEVKKVEKEVKEDVDNKCHNAVDYFNKVNEVYNASCKAGIQNKYETQADRLEAGKKY